MDLTQQQKKLFREAWFIYGNSGRKSTMLNHKLIQGFLEFDENRIDVYKEAETNMKERYSEENFQKLKHQLPTEECFQFCKLVLKEEFTKAIKLAKS